MLLMPIPAWPIIARRACSFSLEKLDRSISRATLSMLWWQAIFWSTFPMSGALRYSTSLMMCWGKTAKSFSFNRITTIVTGNTGTTSHTSRHFPMSAWAISFVRGVTRSFERKRNSCPSASSPFCPSRIGLQNFIYSHSGVHWRSKCSSSPKDNVQGQTSQPHPSDLQRKRLYSKSHSRLRRTRSRRWNSGHKQ